MARTDLAVQTVDMDGIDEVALLAAANVDGHAIVNDAKTFLVVFNSDVSGITVTIKSNRTVDGLALPDKSVAVAAGERRIIWLGSRETFNQSTATETGASDKGKVYVNFSAVTSVTVMAFRKA